VSTPRVGSLWWIVLFRAIVALVLGIGVLVGGGERPFLANFIAVYWLLGSLLTLRWVLAHRWITGARLALAAALVGITAATLVLLREVIDGAITRETTFDLLGVTAIMSGALRLLGGFHDDQIPGVRPRLRHRILIGILDVGLGIALVLTEGRSTATVIVAGVWALVGGTLLLLDALTLRRLGTAPTGPSPS